MESVAPVTLSIILVVAVVAVELSVFHPSHFDKPVSTDPVKAKHTANASIT